MKRAGSGLCVLAAALRYDMPSVHLAGRVAEVDGQKVIYTETVDLR